MYVLLKYAREYDHNHKLQTNLPTAPQGRDTKHSLAGDSHNTRCICAYLVKTRSVQKKELYDL